MSLPWLPVNSKLQSGITLINQLKPPKFKVLLEHIITSENDDVFTPEEFQKLSTSLKLEAGDLRLLVRSLLHIYQHSSQVIIKPTVLHQQLQSELKLDEQLAGEFVRQWTESTNEQFDLQNTRKLENISWELNVQTGSNVNNREVIPNARIQLGLSTRENVTLELNQDELESFYNTIETIQNKLDTLF